MKAAATTIAAQAGDIMAGAGVTIGVATITFMALMALMHVAATAKRAAATKVAALMLNINVPTNAITVADHAIAVLIITKIAAVMDTCLARSTSHAATKKIKTTTTNNSQKLHIQSAAQPSGVFCFVKYTTLKMKKAALYLMVLLYVITGVLHFVYPASYVRIMPSWLPYPSALVATSGVCETLFALLLLPAATRRAAAWLIILLLIAVFPANVQMAVNYWHAHSPYLWLAIIRLPLQAALIWWAWLYTDKKQQVIPIKK